MAQTAEQRNARRRAYYQANRGRILARQRAVQTKPTVKARRKATDKARRVKAREAQQVTKVLPVQYDLDKDTVLNRLIKDTLYGQLPLETYAKAVYSAIQGPHNPGGITRAAMIKRLREKQASSEEFKRGYDRGDYSLRDPTRAATTRTDYVQPEGRARYEAYKYREAFLPVEIFWYHGLVR